MRGSCFKLRCFSTMPVGNLISRNKEYSGGVKRFPVPDDKVSWKVDWPDYRPVDYTAASVAKNPPWADPDFR